MWDNAQFLVKLNSERIKRWRTPLMIPAPPLWRCKAWWLEHVLTRQCVYDMDTWWRTSVGTLKFLVTLVVIGLGVISGLLKSWSYPSSEGWFLTPPITNKWNKNDWNQNKQSVTNKVPSKMAGPSTTPTAAPRSRNNNERNGEHCHLHDGVPQQWSKISDEELV